MKTHFKELTGMGIDDKAIANKCATLVSYFKDSEGADHLHGNGDIKQKCCRCQCCWVYSTSSEVFQ